MTPKKNDAVDAAGMEAILEKQRKSFLEEGPPSYSQRMEDLEQIAQAIRKQYEGIVEGIVQDFGSRSRHEIMVAEIYTTLSAIHYMKKNLKKWMKPRKRSVNTLFMPGRAKVIMAPLGVVGVISPWNYPFYLAMVPTITAIAAGNRVMLKPSVFTPRTSQAMKDLLTGIFPPEKVSVIFSGPGVGSAFSNLAFDHLCFTGSTSVGRQVMEAASKNLTPVTLELGGKSPTILGQDYDVAQAAQTISFGKLFNAGQTCIAPDYALVPEGKMDQFVQCYQEAVRGYYPTLAKNPDFTSIITERHYKRLNHALDDAREKGATIISINPANEAMDASIKKIAPTLVLNATDDMILLQDEIFGPILPVLPYTSLDKAIRHVNARPQPLALYFFSNNSTWTDRVLERTHFGGAAINNVLLHVAQDDLPFGGVGPSGMGRYHGQEGFETFCNLKGVFYQGAPHAQRFIRPPYRAVLERLMRFMIQRL